LKRRLAFLIHIAVLLGAAIACSQSSSPPIIYVTATPPTVETVLPTVGGNLFQPTVTPKGPTATPLVPTPNATRPPSTRTLSYTVKAGDNLAALAILYGTTVQEIARLNPGLNESGTLTPNQTLNLPETPSQFSPAFKIIPDSELVNSPGARGFDVVQFVNFQPGFLRVYSEFVQGRLLTGAQIIQVVAQQNSINPRLLLAMLEFKAGWITNPAPGGNKLNYPMGNIVEARKGLFRQLAWAADWLNDGYYGWKHRGLTALQFPDGTRIAFNSQLNAGSVAIQYFLGQTADRNTWSREISGNGFFGTYLALFGDPFRYAIEPLVPPNLVSPTMQLPFAQGETWFYTGGPHGGWDAASGWAGIDFAPPAPPDELIALQGACYISPNFAVATMPGVIVRSGDGAVVLDQDLDGDERTGWTVLYLHIAASESVRAGKVVAAGEKIGHPSCEGFNLNAVATHLHIARRYNGEWIAAGCWACQPDFPAISWTLSDWRVTGLPDQIFQGTMVKDGVIRRAEQGRDQIDNQISW
jgi:murein DD-endopeptidase MepM/ murein hydrolase activator NlpD